MNTTARWATPTDAEQVTDAFLEAMLDDSSWPYRFPYRREYADDHRKYNGDLIRRFISPDYEDWGVMVIDAEDPLTQEPKVVAFAIWDLTYLNKRRYGSDYQGKAPPHDTREAGGKNRKDANPKHTATFQKALTDSRKKYFAVFGDERMNLQILGTMPSFRRRGFASTLVRWGIDKATKDGVALTLNASEQGLRLYKSLGFVVLGPQQIQALDEEEHIVNTAMVYQRADEVLAHPKF